MDKKIVIKDFDDVFPYIGGFGPYQYIIFIVLCLVNCFFGFTYYGQIFMTITPPHWCSWETELQEKIWDRFGRNITDEDMKRVTLPKNLDGFGYSKCQRYTVNFDEIEMVNGRLEPNTSWPLESCIHGWSYNYSFYYPTITSQLDWVCDDDWKVPSAQASFFIGCMVGTLFFGWVADNFGRIPAAIATNLLAGIFGIASAFSSSFLVFCILRFMVGLAFDSHFTVVYILGLEYVSAKYRTVIANVPFVIFLTASMCAMPWIAYALHNWHWFGVAMHTPLLLAAFFPWVIPESVRWLLRKGNENKALNIVQQVAKTNGKKISQEFVDIFKSFAHEVAQEPENGVTWYHLLKTPNLRKRFFILIIMWIAIFLAYDGHVRHTENIATNIFVTFTLMGAVELPGDLLSMLGMEYFGRKHTLVWSMFACGIVTMAMIGVPAVDVSTTFALSLAGRFLITVAMNVAMQYVIEIIPTVVRVQGSSAIHTFGLGMGFVSPYILYSEKLHHWLPYLLFGLICIGGSLVSLLLPETKGEKLPDSLKEGEEYFCNQPIFYNPRSSKAGTQECK